MHHRFTSAFIALSAAIALCACANDTTDTTAEPELGASTAPESGTSTEDVATTSEALHHEGGGHEGGGHEGGGHEGGWGHGGWGHGGWGHGGWDHGGWDHGGWGHGGWGHGGWGHGGWGHGGGYPGRLVRGHYGYGPGGVVVVGEPVYVGVPQQYYGWIRNSDLELQCQSIGWGGQECSFVSETAACIPNVGCFVRPY